MSAERIRTQWAAAGVELGVADAAAWAEVGERVIERHREPRRVYHGVAHVVAVLDALAELVGPLSAELVAAALFHDAIYDPTSTTNEADSAVLAAEELGAMGVREAAVARVVEMIEATATHDLSAIVHADVAMAGAFLDADLSILGAPDDVYRRYAAAIRTEYSHVSDEDFRHGRAAILDGFLTRQRRFFTDRAHALWDAQARHNLTQELATLKKGV